MQHPIRALEIVAYRRSEQSEIGPAWISRFSPDKGWPILFQGASEDEVIGKAEAFRSETIAKHEAAYIKRQEALQKARAAKKAANQ